MKLLVTGGCGFIGSHFIRMALSQDAETKVLNVDLLTYAGRGKNLADLKKTSRYKWVKTDIAGSSIHGIIQKFHPDAILNFAAESHVDRSLHDASVFMRTNILGTQNLVDAARRAGIPRFLQVSTDEVYGSIPGDARANEDSQLHPSSPYSASKAAADLYCQAIHSTYRQNIVITRCTNNYGSHQFPEKLIPLMITNALNDIPLPIYGNGMQQRDWIHVEDHCRGIMLALKRGKAGEIYNFGMGSEPPNITIVKLILRILGKPEKLITYVQDRPGHDQRYAVDTAKAQRDLGWSPKMNFADGLKSVVQWYVKNPKWWFPLKDAAFRKFYRKNYKTC